MRYNGPESSSLPARKFVHRIATTMGWVGGLISGSYSWIRRQFHREPRILTREEKKAMRRESKKHRKAA